MRQTLVKTLLPFAHTGGQILLLAAYAVGSIALAKAVHCYEADHRNLITPAQLRRLAEYRERLKQEQ